MTATKDITDVQVVAACVAGQGFIVGRTSQRVCSLDMLVEMTGAPEKVCLRALERADRRGLIGYGVNIRWAWPTPEGQRLYRQSQP